MTDDERRVLADIDMSVPWSLVERFSTMPRAEPDDVSKAADELVSRLEGLGLPVTVHEPELWLTVPLSASVDAGGRTMTGKAPAGCADARHGVTGPLRYVPAAFAKGSEDVFDTFDPDAASAMELAGAVVVTEGFASPATVTNLEALGAIAVIAVNPGVDAHWGTCTSVWGVPALAERDRAPSIPAINVPRPDGDDLRKLADAGETATVLVEMRTGWFRSKLPEVRIGGDEDDFVLLHGHYDAWSVGVGDNATGDATMLEVARVLWNHRARLKRGVRIAWWPGHSTGRYAGSTWYADAFGVELYEHCVAQVNCDSPGCRWATEYKDVSLTAESETFAASVIRDAVGQSLHSERAAQAGDYSFNNLGLSGYFMLLSTMPDDVRETKGYYGVGGCGGNIAWHTEHDTIEIADRDILEKDIRIYLLAVYRNATVERLPLDWGRAVRGHLATLDAYQAAAGDRFDLSVAREEAERLAAAISDFESASDAGGVEADVADHVLKTLSRILVPLDYAQRGRFDHDPALTIPPLPDLAACRELAGLDANDLRFATTGLMRGRNRVVSSLRDARRALEGALAAAGSVAT